MSEADPFQSVSVVRRLLKNAGVRPSRRRGQSFLVDRHAMERLVDSAQLTDADLVLEVGTGTGGLTGYLLARAGRVVTIELDRKLAATAERLLGDDERLALLTGDVLRRKHELNPEVIESLLRAWRTGKFERFKLVANLPYSVAVPVVAELLRFEPVPERMCFTVQHEVGMRLSAQPDSSDYGWLSVWVQSMAAVERLADLSASCFYPKPKVDSTVMRLLPNSNRPSAARIETFRRVVQYLFQHRRKMLSRNLRDLCRQTEGATWTAEGILDETGLDGRLRAQALGVESFRTLSNAILAHTPHGRNDEEN